MTLLSRLQSIFGFDNTQKPSVTKNTKLGDPSILRSDLYDSYSSYTKMPENRRELYDLYDSMDEGEISAILSTYAEDATQQSVKIKKKVWVESKDKNINLVLNNLFNRLRVNDLAESIVRDMAKYGDEFQILNFSKLASDDILIGQYLEKDEAGKKVDPKTITNWVQVCDPAMINRIEDEFGRLMGYEENRNNIRKEDLDSFKAWEIIHFKNSKTRVINIGGQRVKNDYGTSILYPAIQSGKQLQIMDDMLVMHRVLRSLDRHIYYVDVGHAAREDEINLLKRWKNALKRKTWINPVANAFKQKFDPMSFLEDIFWPTREGSNSKVETLQGQPNVADIVDHKRFVNKFYGTLRAPKGYFGHEDQASWTAKNTLAQQDVQFGRTVNALQMHFIAGLVHLCQIELVLRGFDSDPAGFTISMVLPSSLEEMQRLENNLTKIEYGERMVNFGKELELFQPEWKKFVLYDVFGFSEDQIEKFTKTPEPPSDQEMANDKNYENDNNINNESVIKEDIIPLSQVYDLLNDVYKITSSDYATGVDYNELPIKK